MSGEKVCLNISTVECKIALHVEAYSTAVLFQESLCIITSANCRIIREKNVCKDKHVHFVST